MFFNKCWIGSKKKSVSSFYKENNFKPCLTKQLLNMFKLWCERGICLDNWKHRLGFGSARAALCKWTACTRQTFLSKTFENSLNMQKQCEKNVWEKSNDTYSLSVRVDHKKLHFDLFFTIISTSKKLFFFRARAEKGVAWHIDPSSVVWTLIYHGKLANQIARIAAIVVENSFDVSFLYKGHRRELSEPIRNSKQMHVDDSKRGKTRTAKLGLLLLIGSKNGARFF